MADIYYEKISARINVADGADGIVTFDRTTQPYEDLTFWVYPADSAQSVSYTVLTRLNAVANGVATAVTTALPTKVQIAGIFPPNDSTIQASVVPSVVVHNASGSARTFVVLILGRVYGAAST